MKKNQISLLFAAAVASGILFCQSAKAFVLPYVVDQITFSGTGQVASTPDLGGTGLIPGWNVNTPEITYTNGDGSLDGSGLGLEASAGGKIWISGITNGVSSYQLNGTYNQFVQKGTIAPLASAPTNMAYYSFLYRFNVGSDVPSTGVMIALANRQNSGITSPATFHWRLIAKNVGGTTVQLGITKENNDAINTQTNYSTTNLVAGQTYFIVVRSAITNLAQVVSTTNPETENLWINPDPSTFGLGEASVPAYAATTTNGLDDNSTTGQGRFWVCDSGASANFDELRIAPTWALVTPPFGSCFTALVTTDLTNEYQSAEINASFSTLAGLATSPTYQWQRYNGSVFTNIPGATLVAYTTPNLQYGPDNGAQYRCIVHVSCDSSSATTSVSTVTLYPPGITANGTIMDDTFSDGFRANGTVGANNSFWFTSVTTNLTVNPAATAMVYWPYVGTSGLRVGYFVDESTTNLPVELGVGSAIKVTIPFKVGVFNKGYTNNGALRFGLFDYADGGTIITTDSSAAPIAVTGSAGNGQGVRGYICSLDFGTNFSSALPITHYVRTATTDVNLMGTTSDYTELDAGGPTSVIGGLSNAPAFAATSNYTLVFTVQRLLTNACSVSTSITQGTGYTNWSWVSVDTNNYGYHRFDSFAIRDNEEQNYCNTDNITEFKVEVLNAALSPTSISMNAITNVSISGGYAKLSWNPSPAGAYVYSVLSKTNLTDATWTTNVSSYVLPYYTDPTATAGHRFYRVTSP